jgi:hypothetical protein
MVSDRFLAARRRGVHHVFLMFVGLALLMWAATLCDQVFNLGWGWDKEGLWALPLMVLGSAFVRFCSLAIIKLTSSLFNGG